MTWIESKQVDNAQHMDHEELIKIGVVLSSRDSSQNASRPVNHRQEFENQDSNDTEEQK